MTLNNAAASFRGQANCVVDDPTRFSLSVWLNPLVQKFVPMEHFEKPLWDNRLLTEDGEPDQRWQDIPLRVGECPNVVGFRRNESFEADRWLAEDTINWGNHQNFGGGRSVMLPALRILYLLGFRRVYLLGVDFEMTPEKRYSFDEQRIPEAIACNNVTYNKLQGWLSELQPKFLEAGFVVQNCNPQSKLKAFPKISLLKALQEATSLLGDFRQERVFGMYRPIEDKRAESKTATRKEEFTPAGKLLCSHQAPIAAAEKGKSGVLYYNTGTSCVVRLLVSLVSLRQHYLGPVTILSEGEQSHHFCQQIGEATGVDVVDWQSGVPNCRNRVILAKTRYHLASPYEKTIVLDADTLVCGSLDQLFDELETSEFCVAPLGTQRTVDPLYSNRIRAWAPFLPKEQIDAALRFGPAINCGVVAFRRGAKLLDEWSKVALIARDTFIPDEVSCQILLPRMPHRIVHERWNRSCRWGSINEDIRVIHYHGRKHCRPGLPFEGDKWMKKFERVRELNFAGIQSWSPAGDVTLASFLAGKGLARPEA